MSNNNNNNNIPPHIPPSSIPIARELGILFGFLLASLVIVAVYAVVWRAIERRDEERDKLRKERLVARGVHHGRGGLHEKMLDREGCLRRAELSSNGSLGGNGQVINGGGQNWRTREVERER